MPFAEFMEVALYHPRGGYYSGPSPLAADGDYFTSPAAHPGFGALIAILLRHMWEVLGGPDRFTVVEMGAGAGLLARDVVDYAAGLGGGFAQSMRYVAPDRRLPSAQRGTRSSAVQRIVGRGLPLKGVVGCVISNELVDSFPVHRFQIDQGGVREMYVTVDDHGRFTELLDRPSTHEVAARVSKLGVGLPEGFRGEVNLDLPTWMGDVSAALDRGFVVTVDYGYETRDLLSADKAAGTVQTYYRHAPGGSPFGRVGRQDITAAVDFSAIASEGESLGLRPFPLATQARFLRDLGFDKMLERLRKMELGQRARQANMMAMLELVKEEGLGGFKVLIQERATGVNHLSQLMPTHRDTHDLDVPLLGPHDLQLMEARYPHLAWEPGGLWPFEEEQ